MSTASASRYVFTTERLSPITTAGYPKMLARVGGGRANFRFRCTRMCSGALAGIS